MMEFPASAQSVELTRHLASFRQTVLCETGDIVSQPPAGCDDLPGSLPRITELLACSLEELRVAEEELAEQGAALAVRQRVAEYERRLFDFAPVGLLATDLMGAITEANRAAAGLLGRAMDDLRRKPIASLVPLPERSAFRDQLSRLSIAAGATDWRFRVARADHPPVAVSAAVQVVGGGNRCGGAALFWSLRPI